MAKQFELRKSITLEKKAAAVKDALLPNGYVLIIIKIYIYHALINALGTHMIHVNLNMIFCTHVEHNPTKTIYIKYYTEKQTHTLHTHTHTQVHACTHTYTHTTHTHTH